MGIISKIKEFLYSGPVKNVPIGHTHCPTCGGNGFYDTFLDCLDCDGKGHVTHEKASSILKEMDSN